MFPAITRIPAYQASMLESQNGFGCEASSSKGVSDFFAKFSSDVAKHSAAQILYDVRSFLASTQTDKKDGRVLCRLLRERCVDSSSIGRRFISEEPSSKYVGHQSTQILKDVDSFLTSQYTTREDGIALRCLLDRKSLGDLSSCTDSVFHQTKNREVLNSERVRVSTAYQTLIDNYDKIVEGLFDYQTKKIANRLMHKGVLSSGEFLIICSKPAGSAKAIALLEMVTTVGERRPSLDLATSKFKEALRVVNPELANIFTIIKDEPRSYRSRTHTFTV